MFNAIKNGVKAFKSNVMRYKTFFDVNDIYMTMFEK